MIKSITAFTHDPFALSVFALANVIDKLFGNEATVNNFWDMQMTEGFDEVFRTNHTPFVNIHIKKNKVFGIIMFNLDANVIKVLNKMPAGKGVGAEKLGEHNHAIGFLEVLKIYGSFNQWFTILLLEDFNGTAVFWIALVE